MAKPKIHISLFGAGNVATHLARKFVNHPDIELVQMYNRDIDKLSEFKDDVAIINDLSKVKPADIFIIAITDDAIAKFSEKLAKFKVLTVHTSGSVAMNDLQVDKKGVFYPFQTFSKQKKIDFEAIPILIEATYKNDLALLRTLGEMISNNVKSISSESRKALHIGGVFVSNFVNHLYYQADKLLAENNLPFDLLKPLIIEVAEKVMHVPPQQAQTGPASRGDQRIIDEHLQFLTDSKQKEIYQLLTQSILESK